MAARFPERKKSSWICLLAPKKQRNYKDGNGISSNCISAISERERIGWRPACIIEGEVTLSSALIQQEIVRFPRSFRKYFVRNKFSDRMRKQLLNSVLAKYRDLSVSRRSRYFAQPRPITVNFFAPWYWNILAQLLSTDIKSSLTSRCKRHFQSQPVFRSTVSSLKVLKSNLSISSDIFTEAIYPRRTPWYARFAVCHSWRLMFWSIIEGSVVCWGARHQDLAPARSWLPSPDYRVHSIPLAADILIYNVC